MANTRLSDPVPMGQIVLMKIRKEVSLTLGATSAESLEIRDQYMPGIAAHIVRATFDVLSDKIAEDTYTTRFSWKTPKSAWQLLKKQKAPAWFKRRWPVQYEHHTYKRLVKLTRIAEYPKANVAIPRENRQLFLHTLGGLEVIRDEVRDAN